MFSKSISTSQCFFQKTTTQSTHVFKGGCICSVLSCRNSPMQEVQGKRNNLIFKCFFQHQAQDTLPIGLDTSQNTSVAEPRPVDSELRCMTAVSFRVRPFKAQSYETKGASNYTSSILWGKRHKLCVQPAAQNWRGWGGVRGLWIHQSAVQLLATMRLRRETAAFFCTRTYICCWSESIGFVLNNSPACVICWSFSVMSRTIPTKE